MRERWARFWRSPVVAPTACYEIYAAWKEGDAELARLKQERIAVAAQRVVGDLGVPGVKYGMDFNGYFGGPARLPLLPLTAKRRARSSGCWRMSGTDWTEWRSPSAANL